MLNSSEALDRNEYDASMTNGPGSNGLQSLPRCIASDDRMVHRNWMIRACPIDSGGTLGGSEMSSPTQSIDRTREFARVLGPFFAIVSATVGRTRA